MGKAVSAFQHLERRHIGDREVHRTGDKAVAVNVMMDDLGVFKVGASGNYYRRSQGSTKKLTRTIGGNFARADQIIGITVNDDLGATREV